MHGAAPSVPRLEGWVTLTALAQATRRLRLCTLVTGVHYRHPAVLANMAATLDIVSGGRLELSLGTGWNEEESGAYGIELGTPRQHSDRFEEACAVLTGLLSPQETTTFQGRYYTLTAARCDPKPVQQPHPPICSGGHGEQRTLRTATGRGSGCPPRCRSPATVAAAATAFGAAGAGLDRLPAAAAHAGRAGAAGQRPGGTGLGHPLPADGGAT